MPHIEHIFICLAHRLPMKQVPEALAVAEKGFERCAHGRPGERQILLMAAEDLAELDLTPGAIKENIVTRGLDVMRLKRGQRLRAGEAELEITVPCHPCKRMDDIRPGLRAELRGRRGMLCRVVRGGWIRAGDAIENGSQMNTDGGN